MPRLVESATSMHESVGGWDLTSTVFMLGGGAIAGLAVGYALKVATRLVLLVVGLLILALYALMAGGYVTVDWQALGGGLEVGGRALGHWVWGMVGHLGASLVGFAGGVAMGWRMR